MAVAFVSQALRVDPTSTGRLGRSQSEMVPFKVSSVAFALYFLAATMLVKLSYPLTESNGGYASSVGMGCEAVERVLGV